MTIPEHLIIRVERKFNRIHCAEKLCGREIGFLSGGGNNVFLHDYRECRQEHFSTVTEYREHGVPVSLIVNKLVEIEDMAIKDIQSGVNDGVPVTLVSGDVLENVHRPEIDFPELNYVSAVESEIVLEEKDVFPVEDCNGGQPLSDNSIFELIDQLVCEVVGEQESVNETNVQINGGVLPSFSIFK